MIRVALWTPALLVLATIATARIYEQCELARDLMSFGISYDDAATWVCIAYHESRFDTAANNPHSGDHGIFQISELYWCGSGKACGLPCSAFRDGDIRDDLKCALRIHEEHTRLQGNGFMAWVVYPQNCKHNTKKYIVDCNRQSKNELRSFDTFSHDVFNNISFNYNTRPVNNRLPSYLAVSSLFRANYGKMLDLNNQANIDWYNYKVENIDALKLPVLGDKTKISITSSSTSTPSTTTVYIPPVMPWRTIETNQFRRKPTAQTTYTTSTTKEFENYTEKTTTKETSTFKPIILTTVSKLPSSTIIATRRPFTVSSSTSTTTKLTNVTKFVYKPTVKTATFKPFTITSVPLLSQLSSSTPTPKKNIISTTTYKPIQTPTSARSTLSSPKTTPTSNIYLSSIYTTPISSSTPRTTTTSAKTRYIYTPFSSVLYKTTPTPYNSFPSIYTSRISSTTVNTTTRKLPTAEKSWSSIQNSPSTLRPITTRLVPNNTISTTSNYYSSTKPPSQIKTATTSPKVEATTAKSNSKITTSTESIFNLYLNPTKQPKFTTYDFSNFNDKKFKFIIFSDGTTPSPAKRIPVPNRER